MTTFDDAVPAADFELTPEDWEEVNAVHLMGTSLFAEQVSSTRTLVFLLFTILATLMLVMGSTLGAVLFGATAVIAPLLVGPLQEKGQRQALKKMGEQGIGAGTFGHHRIEVRDEGLYHRTSAFEVLMRWHAIQDVKDQGDHLFVYTGTHAFIPIPTTAFPDQASFRRFADAFMAKALGSRGEPGMLPDAASPTTATSADATHPSPGDPEGE